MRRSTTLMSALVVVSCRGSSEHAAASAVESVTVSPADAGSPATTRTRHARRPPAPHREPLPSSSGDTTELNAYHEGREFIIVDVDNTCFYESTDGMPMHTRDINPWRKIVTDCPAEYDDPAWDDCILGRMRGIRGDKNCECMNSGATEKWATACPRATSP
jgi:hypothetical protein